MYIRDVEKKLIKLAEKFPIIAVLGPRQSGKTTLVQKVFGDYSYSNLENINQRDLAQSDPSYFLKSYQKNRGLIIDEAQHAPNLFSYLQLEVDEKEGKGGRFILTGSQNILMNQNISQSLAGRIAIIDLLPLSLNELKNAKRLPSDLDDVLFQGGYPRIYEKELDPSDWHLNYVRTYLERDVRQLKNVSDLSAFQRFLKLCAGRVGQVVNFSDLGRDCGITYHTAKAWLSVLEASFIVFMLSPHYKNFSQRVIKSKKIYFYDTGLLCSLLKIESKDQLSNHYLRGGIFESYIISELVKKRLNQGKESNCYYWRDSKGHEVDCILEEAGKVIPVEIKSGQTIKGEFFKNLSFWRRLSGVKAEDAYLIYGGDENQIRREGNVLGWSSLNDIHHR